MYSGQLMTIINFNQKVKIMEAFDQQQPQITQANLQQNAIPYDQYENIMEENISEGDGYMGQEENSISSYNTRIHELQQKQQILKYSVAQHQQSVKELFINLYNKKRKLLQLMTSQYNQNGMNLDIGLLEQFQQLRKKITSQQAKIATLKASIESMQVVPQNNDRNYIILKQKKDEIEKQIQSGRRFAASQYVRDYLERTYIHKVSYQDVKYQYEVKTKLKQYLRLEKESYDKKREQIRKALEAEIQLFQELEEEKKRIDLTLQKVSSRQ